MHISNAALIFLIITQVQGFYSDSEVVDCNADLSNEELSQAIKLQTLDKYFFLIISFIAFILTMIIMLSFIIYPKTWKMPGDIIFFISFCEALLCVHWFCTSIYFLINDCSPLSDETFCQLNSLVSIFAGAGEVTYNLIFCIYVRITLKEQFAAKKRLPYVLHSIAWCTMISVTLIAKLLNYNGLSLFGTCSLKYNPGFNFAGLILVFVNAFMSVYTILYIKAAVPKNQRYLNLIGKVTQYYSSYITAQFCIQLTQAISYILVGLNCTKYQKGWLLIFITIANSAKLCTPFILSILRLKDPTIRRQIQQIRKYFQSKSSVSSSLLIEEQNLTVIAKTLLLDKVNTIVYSIQQIFQQDNYQEDKRKGNYLQSILNVNGTKQKIELDDKISQENIDEETQFIIPPEQDLEFELRLMASTIIIYAPKVFFRLRKKDSQGINYSKSFDPIANQEQINSFIGPDGGKGGAFFFFTFDNKLLIKTISEQELLVIKKNLGSYFSHLNKNESLISPIYGMFKFVLQNGQESQIFIVMRNALQIPSSNVIRTYDLKGSEYQRKVLKQNDVNIDLTKITLKDIDFKEKEGKLFIPENIKDRLRNSLIQDSKFFQELNLMDYSLLIIKMNWQSVSQNNSEMLSQIFKIFNSQLNFIPSIQEKGVYYHIAIIDYLQEWNAGKKLEQVTKKAINVNIELDTSAQNPQEYTKRFIEKVVYTII